MKSLTLILAMFFALSAHAGPTFSWQQGDNVTPEVLENLALEYQLANEYEKTKGFSVDNSVMSLFSTRANFAGKSSFGSESEMSFRRGRGERCDDGPVDRPPRQGCVDAVCKRIGSYKCDELSEIQQVGKACRGMKLSCLESVCSRIGSYKCDELSEIQQVGRACKNIYNGGCMDAVCSRIGSYKCDELSEIQQVGKACRGNVSVSCIDSVCSRIGSYKCDELSEITSVAKSCSGRD